MTDQSIFNNSSTEATPQTPPANSNPQVPPQDNSLFTDQLAAITNERGEQKYSTVPEALKGTAHAQQHILDLKQELEDLKNNNTSLRDDLSNRPTLSTIEEMLASQTPATPGQTLGEEDVTTIVANALAKSEADSKAQAVAITAKANLDTVIKTVVEAHGEKAEEVFYAKAQEMGMTIEAFNTLASQSPQVVLQLVGGKAVQSSITPMTGGANTTNFQPQQESKANRNTLSILNGASTKEKLVEVQASKDLVAELDKAGMSTYDLSKPSEYFKHFGN